MKNASSIIKYKNHLHTLKVNKVLNKASACAKYALRFLNLKRGSLFIFGNQAQAVGEGVG